MCVVAESRPRRSRLHAYHWPLRRRQSRIGGASVLGGNNRAQRPRRRVAQHATNANQLRSRPLQLVASNLCDVPNLETPGATPAPQLFHGLLWLKT